MISLVEHELKPQNDQIFLSRLDSSSLIRHKNRGNISFPITMLHLSEIRILHEIQFVDRVRAME